jgi:hypothetical protein
MAGSNPLLLLLSHDEHVAICASQHERDRLPDTIGAAGYEGRLLLHLWNLTNDNVKVNRRAAPKPSTGERLGAE